MELSLRYIRGQTRRFKHQCCVLILAICAVLYLSFIAFAPDSSQFWRSNPVSLDYGLVQFQLKREDKQRVSLLPPRERNFQPFHEFNVSEYFLVGEKKKIPTPSLTFIRADLSSVTKLRRQSTSNDVDLEQQRTSSSFADKRVQTADDSARFEAEKRSQQQDVECVFPEVQGLDLASIDLSRVGQLNLLYFDSAPYAYHPPQRPTHNDSVARRRERNQRSSPHVPDEQKKQRTGKTLPENNVTEPVTSADLQMAFQPIISADERLLMLTVFQTFIQTCQTHNLTYFLYGGSLLGAFRHHDVIPWDDDVDVMLAAWQRPLAAKVLSSVPGFGLWTPAGRQWKFYWSRSPTLRHKRYRWPYVDIFFFASNGSHLYDDGPEYRADFRFPISHVFPLQLRPFAGALLPVPCNMVAVLRANYFPWLCVTSPFLHKLEWSAPRHLKARVACSRLFPLFPFVLRQRRHLAGSVYIVETLVKGGKVLTRTVLPSFCGEGRDER